LLLCHSFFRARSTPVLSTLSLHDALPIFRVDTVPGSVSRYSGGGLVVMQQLLMDVTGEPFPALMKGLVLAPTGMTLSTYEQPLPDRKSTRLNSSHVAISYAVFCLKKKRYN